MSSDDSPLRRRRLLAADRWPLALRLTSWYALSSFVVIVMATGALYWTLAANLRLQDEQFLSNKIHVLRGLLKFGERNRQVILQEIGEDVDGPRQLYVRILTMDNRLLFESAAMSAKFRPGLFPVPIEGNDLSGASVDVRSVSGDEFRIVAATAIFGTTPEATPVLIQAAIEISTTEALLARYRHSLAVVLAGALFLSALAGYQIAKRGLLPLRSIASATQSITMTTLHERIPTERLSGEMKDLATTFNAMLDRIEASLTRLMQFSDDLAHELRGPVGNALGSIEVALSQPRSASTYREVLETTHEELQRLARTVNSLLFLARSENPATVIERETVNLEQEFRAICEFFDAPAQEAGISLRVEIEPALKIFADRGLLQRALHNLIANATAHTGRGGSVVLRARAGEACIDIEVADTGCGIADHHLPHLFDRFYRVESSRTREGDHVGLGLPIARSILALHAGTLVIESKVGQGTTARMHFPQPSDWQRSGRI